MANVTPTAVDCGSVPKSDETKDAPRCGALMLGACAAALLPDVEREAVARRLAEWRPHYLLTTPEHHAAFELMVTSALRLERCREQEAALRHCERSRALLRWDAERKAQAAALSKKLARQPAAVASQLEQTRQGVEWLLERWEELRYLLEAGADWELEQHKLALDLTGTPRATRARTPEIPDPAGLVAGEMARLRRLKADSLDAMDELERDLARAGTPIEPSAAMLRLQRHEAACLREYRRVVKELRPQHVATPSQATAPAPAPTPKPAPAPAAASIRRDPVPVAPAVAPGPAPLPSKTNLIKPSHMTDEDWQILEARYLADARRRWNCGP